MNNFIKIHGLKSGTFLLCALLLVSCSKDENNLPDGGNSALTGTWTETAMAQPNGHFINELTFNNDSTFSSRTTSYGVYSGQSQNDLSGWFEYAGNYSLNGTTISFISHRVVSWDSFYGGQPDTQIKDQLLFENCKYTIVDQVLEINYITYPADAPENTTRQYIKTK
jgi:hypothetical protein